MEKMDKSPLEYANSDLHSVHDKMHIAVYCREVLRKKGHKSAAVFRVLRKADLRTAYQYEVRIAKEDV